LDGSLPEFAHWDQLMLDNQRGARLATEHLIARGHRQIAFFGGHRDSSSCRQRHAGYAEAMHGAGLSIKPNWRVDCAPTRLDAARSADQLFEHEDSPTAAVCYNDAVALGLMLGLNQRGLSPGKNFALTGFDDIAESALSMPPLTTLATSPRERGQQAASMILRRLGDTQSESRQIVAPVTLVVRQTSCPPPSH
ncbi:MAG: substrate-binding domain-containing protein, partial [Rhodanobacter sp.]